MNTTLDTAIPNFHISKCTDRKNTRNQAPPFAIDLNENFIVYITHLVFTPNPPSRPTIDNSTKNSVSTVHIHYSCEMAIFPYFCTLNHCKYSQGPFLIGQDLTDDIQQNQSIVFHQSKIVSTSRDNNMQKNQNSKIFRYHFSTVSIYALCNKENKHFTF